MNWQKSLQEIPIKYRTVYNKKSLIHYKKYFSNEFKRNSCALADVKLYAKNIIKLQKTLLTTNNLLITKLMRIDKSNSKTKFLSSVFVLPESSKHLRNSPQ